MKIAQLQLKVLDSKEANLAQLRREIEAVMAEQPDFVTVGEMFACPYYTPNFPLYAEEDGGPMWRALSAIARDYGVYLSAGSVPELADGKVYNTAYVFDRAGQQIAKHRKVHLFDIDVKGGQSFRESDTLTAGDRHTVFDTEFGRMGLCICFDGRFPELARLMVLDGAQAIFVPAAFNMTTGPAHWEVMHRSRAVDNQCYIVATSPARDVNFSYVAWGHSMIVDPWGKVVTELGADAGAAVTEIDLGSVQQIREQLPLLSARRTDLYELTAK
ncbi:MAG: carbon-nitrogen hydrolase family protein [Mogibacterium sp.]|nr:carbon-nitrogen hydrolase family protein [Mogibacterium sp.]